MKRISLFLTFVTAMTILFVGVFGLVLPATAQNAEALYEIFYNPDGLAPSSITVNNVQEFTVKTLSDGTGIITATMTAPAGFNIDLGGQTVGAVLKDGMYQAISEWDDTNLSSYVAIVSTGVVTVEFKANVAETFTVGLRDVLAPTPTPTPDPGSLTVAGQTLTFEMDAWLEEMATITKDDTVTIVNPNPISDTIRIRFSSPQLFAVSINSNKFAASYDGSVYVVDLDQAGENASNYTIDSYPEQSVKVLARMLDTNTTGIAQITLPAEYATVNTAATPTAGATPTPDPNSTMPKTGGNWDGPPTNLVISHHLMLDIARVYSN